MEKTRNEKGHLLKGHGGLKPKGAVSERTKMWNELGEWFVQEGASKCMRIMNDMEDEEYIKHYTALLEYFKPKQARNTIVGDADAPVQIIISDKLWMKKK